MGTYQATVRWQRKNDQFSGNKYSRKHHWLFDGGLEIPASASPQAVPAPFVDTSAVDPEEAFVASLSSCHMLWFLFIASKEGFIVEDYTDEAEGKIEKNGEGKLALTEVILRPAVTFKAGKEPDEGIFDELHHQAHQKCFIANSVKTTVITEAQLKVA